MATVREIDSFVKFARQQLGNSWADLSIDDVYDRWRESHPSAENALAVQASIQDLENGEAGRPYDEFADEFRKRNNVPNEK